MGFTMICAEIRLEFEVCGNAGCLFWWIWGIFEGLGVFLRGLEIKIHRDCLLLWSSDVFFFWIHRNLVSLLNPDVSGMYGFWSMHRKFPI